MNYKEARIKYGRIKDLSRHRSFKYLHARRNEERISCDISILHDPCRGNEWAKELKHTLSVFWPDMF
jgi:hypothetical protein